MAMTVELPGAEDGGFMKPRFTCDGDNVSPEVRWSDLPDGTKSLILIAEDPDAPLMTFVHWVIYNIPPESKGLSENQPRDKVTPQGYAQGLGGFRKTGYMGPCPPGSKPHRYFFKLYATSLAPTLKEGLGKRDLEKLMKGHLIEATEVMLKYGRK